ncbi:MAG: serine/threonine protein kinase [Kiritimatiellae bacterium]|nr:serine/threonine protein kinase [Kiritimatiellia bacterium]
MSQSKADHDLTRIIEAETATDTQAPEPPELSSGGIGTRHLVAHYRSIIEEQGLYYPVAYRFLKELGRGRQGIVFLGLRQGARGCITRHAIKLFDPSIYPSAKKYWTDMGRIAAQTSRLQTVRSPNLVARDAYEESNGIGYLQMEVIDGVDLRYLLDGRHLEIVKQRATPQEWSRYTDVIFRLQGNKVTIQPGVALYILRQILLGLETLHEMGFVHSDVKPSNVMLDRLGYIKLVDYGRAVRIKEKPSFLLGSPLYMAPEVHRRDPAMLQSDVYSVGLLGLEMFCGQPPIDTGRKTEADLLAAKTALPGKLFDLLPDHVRQNEPFVRVMRRFIEPDPAQRYQSATQAESIEGLRLVHRQLAQLGKDTQYERELKGYMTKLLPAKRPEDELLRI